MKFDRHFAVQSRLAKEHAAWRLLRADNASLILAFITDLFSEDSEVSVSRAKLQLQDTLDSLRQQDLFDSKIGAGDYLTQWLRAGWLREFDDQLSKTDACEMALRFSQSIDERGASTTASHLRIVQDAVRDLTIDVSEDAEQRLLILQRKKQELEHEIAALEAGHFEPLTDVQQRERIREVYQIASVLTSDFRRVEDTIRQLDKDLRSQMIDSQGSRGDTLLALIEKETLLGKTEAGQAFEGFFELLSDSDRANEFRQQLRHLLSEPIAKHLSDSQQRYLRNLMRELNKESDRVLKIRRRTEQSLRQYIEAGSANENRAVKRLINQIEQQAIRLRQQETPLRTSTSLMVRHGHANIQSPESMRLRTPDEKIETGAVIEQVAKREVSQGMLGHLSAVRVQDVANVQRAWLIKHQRGSIGEVIQNRPVQAGIEELVAHIRVAKAVNAVRLEQTETVQISDKTGATLEVQIPTFLLRAEDFPDQLSDLNL
ncbi:DUF3375 domain-containing protein [Salinibius halmophilus]|uniref:DUF3375 domain-containing protein n=1 Tax=Salinibius halmophilus TaxID=1853216 RepID=UPI000E666F8E|nr:DUF3375 domain-containing protein [Salinibius halmophilus]